MNLVCRFKRKKMHYCILSIFIVSFNLLLGLKVKVFEAGIVIKFFSFGTDTYSFAAMITLKVPKPEINTLSPESKLSVIVLKTVSTNASASFSSLNFSFQKQHQLALFYSLKSSIPK